MRRQGDEVRPTQFLWRNENLDSVRVAPAGWCVASLPRTSKHRASVAEIAQRECLGVFSQNDFGTPPLGFVLRPQRLHVRCDNTSPRQNVPRRGCLVRQSRTQRLTCCTRMSAASASSASLSSNAHKVFSSSASQESTPSPLVLH